MGGGATLSSYHRLSPPPLDDTFQENGDDGSGVAVIRGD